MEIGRACRQPGQDRSFDLALMKEQEKDARFVGTRRVLMRGAGEAVLEA